MSGEPPHKTVRSYRLVFRRRWRIFRLQNWRIPLPGGVELRAIGYWLACLVALALASRLPLIGPLLAAMPASLRIAVLPLLGAWALSRAEVDGRSPQRALGGLVLWRARPRSITALRGCPARGAMIAPGDAVAAAPDLYGSRYPRGRVLGPARMLLRYDVAVAPRGGGRGTARQRAARARCLGVRAVGGGPLQQGRVLEVPAGREVIFE